MLKDFMNKAWEKTWQLPGPYGGMMGMFFGITAFALVMVVLQLADNQRNKEK